MNILSGHKKDKGFSSNNKIQQYHGDGTETIIVMGRPFRVLKKINDVVSPYMSSRYKAKHTEEKGSFLFLVENSSHLPEFPRHLALKRTFFGVDQVTEAHKEIDILSRIKDKNIVRVYHSEISRSEGKLGVSIAMEYCPNTLERRIRASGTSGVGTRMTESEIVHVLLAVTSAVGYLHAQQPPIAHRDIRPENIFINNTYTGPGVYKLFNFASAATEAYQCETREEASAAIDDIERHTNPGYRAPEMADPWSKQRISEKVDLWAIGVLVFYMMYLQLPFKPNNMALTGNPKVRFPPGGEGRYTPSLRNIVEHLLEPDPERRWDIFALTNFLRFDDDINRHLGTFVFTETEWPEGWEEQDIKVIGRPQPPKNPPVTYNGEAGHAKIRERTEASPNSTSATSHTANNNNNNNNTTLSIPNLNHPGGSEGGEYYDDDLVLRKTMEILNAGGDPTTNAELAGIIKQQEEALERAKAAARGTAHAADSHSSQPARDTPSPAPAEEAKPKKDVFDDLFAGPAQAPPSATTAPPGSAAASRPGSQEPPKRLTADDLFAAPAMPPPMQPGMMMGAAAPPPAAAAAAPPGFAPAMNNFEWTSGAPMAAQAPGGFAPPPPPAPAAGFAAQPNAAYGYGAYAMPQAGGNAPPPPAAALPAGGAAPGWGNGGGEGGTYMGNMGPFAPPPPAGPAKPDLSQMNFMAPSATNTANDARPPAPAEATAPKPPAVSKKDPFADLFS